MSNWLKFRALDPFEKRLLVRALFALPIVALSLRLLGFCRSKTLLSKSSPRIDPRAELDPIDSELAGKIARTVRIASERGPYRPNCLPRSLVLWWLLRRQGIDSDLRIGVRKTANGVRKTTNGLEGHAWVEHRGLALSDSGDVHQRFVAFGSEIAPAGSRSS